MDKYSENLTQLLKLRGWDMKQKSRISEISLCEHLINKSRKSRPTRRHYGGSVAEGSEQKGGDQDTMYILPQIVVVDLKTINYPSDHLVILMCTENLRPCYPMLRVQEGSENFYLSETNDFLNPLNFVTEIATENDACKYKYISSAKFLRAQYCFITKVVADRSEKVDSYIHGPCTSFESGPLLTDHVYSLEGNEWPQAALEWITRERHFQWPNKTLIEHVVKTKCTFVPLGDPYSSHCDFQWRMSFLLGERQLMWSLTQPQFFCFILLKKLKKRFVDPKHQDTISSYILKTCLFWLIEESPLEIWTQKNLLANVQSCLGKLIQFLESKFVPHYFVRKNNIILNKFKNNEECQKLLITMRNIRNNIMPLIHQDAGIDCFDSNCYICSGQNLGLIEVGKCGWHKDGALFRYFLYMNLENLLHKCTLLDIFQFQHDLRRMGSNVFDIHKKLAWQLSELKLAIIYHRDYIKGKDEHCVHERTQLLTKTESRFWEAVTVDAFCGKLHLATFYLRQKRVEDAIEQIKEACKTKNCLYDGSYSEKRLLQLDPNIEIDVHEEVEIAHDISFYTPDYLCFPDVIAWECLMCTIPEYVIRVHPLIYMYLLEFEAYSSSGNQEKRKEALEKLSKEVENLDGGYWRDIPLNICGYCQMKYGNVVEALNCFVKSYRIRQHQNPCVYYALMIYLEQLS